MTLRATVEALAGLAVFPVAGALALASALVFLPVLFGAVFLVATDAFAHFWITAWALAAAVVAPANAIAAMDAMHRLEWRALWPVVWRSVVAILTFIPAARTLA